MGSNKNTYIWLAFTGHFLVLFWATAYTFKKSMTPDVQLQQAEVMVVVACILLLTLGTVATLAASELRPARMAVVLAAGSLLSITYYDAIPVAFSGSGLAKEAPAVDAIYYSIVTWTTLGYGDITPKAHMKLVAASQAIVGYGYSGMLIGVATALLLQRNEA